MYDLNRKKLYAMLCAKRLTKRKIFTHTGLKIIAATHDERHKLIIISVNFGIALYNIILHPY